MRYGPPARIARASPGLAICVLATRLLVACADEPPPPSPPVVPVVTDSAQLLAPVLADSQSVGRSQASPMPAVVGFNYLTDCDSLLLSVRTPVDTAAGSAPMQLLGTCVANKSYQVLLVARDTLVRGEGRAVEAFLEARAGGFADYDAYAAVVPFVTYEDVRSGTHALRAITPGRARVYRLDTATWRGLGEYPLATAAALDSLFDALARGRVPTQSLDAR